MRKLCLAVMTFLSAAETAFATDFSFAVPVRVENLRFAESVNLGCAVRRLGMPIAVTEHVPVPLTDGSFHGTVTVNVDLSRSGYIRSDVDHWVCELWYSWRRPLGAPSVGISDLATFYQRETGQAIESERLLRGDGCRDVPGGLPCR